ncbi:MAG: hypothetical protein H7833_13485 [Magnetococcus sp. DMHC-1]
MFDLIEQFIELDRDEDFAKFQKDVADSFYNGLVGCYKENGNELKMVDAMVGSLNGKKYKNIRLITNRIHGSTSLVTFDYYGRKVTREAGDTVIIQAITRKWKIIFNKLCIIQNKRDRMDDGVWSIELEQLYFLKNFPKFTGQGIFSGMSEIVLTNRSGCLGAYGLFQSPGDMLLMSASLVEESRKGKAKLSIENISVPCASCSHPSHFVDSEYYLREIAFGGRLSPWHIIGENGFLGCKRFSRNIHDFVRDITHISIGEPVYAFGEVLNTFGYEVSLGLMREIGAGEYINIDKKGNHKFGKSGVSVILLQFEVE